MPMNDAPWLDPLSKCWLEGYHDAQAGIPRHMVPYREGTDKYRAWVSGWIMGVA